jgi:hypothetical protein
MREDALSFERPGSLSPLGDVGKAFVPDSCLDQPRIEITRSDSRADGCRSW